MRQNSLQPGEVLSITSILRTYLEESYVKTLLLHEYSHAATFNNELYGSLESRHSNSSLVYIRVRRGTIEETTRPGFVIKYLKANIVLNNPSQTTELSSETLKSYISCSCTFS